ncbi:transporter substrate-binding domain-containing protein [Alteromonadaceae bacterium M269]|nr:transporter substrate-binding domain-containing protein [Alteromonadaceae bacterium M269]
MYFIMRTLVFITLLVFSFWSVAEPTKVTFYADDSYPPYSYIENGKAKGVYADIIEAISADLPDYEIELVAANWEVGKAKVESGEILGLVGAYFHAHDWPYMYPYSYPLNQETVVTVCGENTFNKETREWPVEYKGLLVGNVAGYDGWLGGEVRTEENTSYANFLEVPSAELALKMVVKDRIDCTLFEKSVFHWTFKNLRDSKQFSTTTDETPHITSIITGETVHIGYSVKALKENKFPFADDLLKKLDIKLHQMRRAGTLKEIQMQYGIE